MHDKFFAITVFKKMIINRCQLIGLKFHATIEIIFCRCRMKLYIGNIGGGGLTALQVSDIPGIF